MGATTSVTGIVYYSLSGHSRRLAERLAKELHGKIVEISDPAYKRPLFGYARAGFNSLRQRGDLAPQSFSSLVEFDRVVLCGPVWTSYPAVPLRALLRSGLAMPPSVSMFLTCGQNGPAKKAIATGEADLGRPFTASASLSNSAEGTAQEDSVIAGFLADLRAAQILPEKS